MSTIITTLKEEADSGQPPIYICFSSIDGTGKTTHVDLLVNELRKVGFKVKKSKEPGNEDLPASMVFRDVMLNAKYTKEMTMLAREFASQAARSISMEKDIFPILDNVNNDNYNFIIQDRGALDGIAYGMAEGNDKELLQIFVDKILQKKERKLKSAYHIYHLIIYFDGDVKTCLERARKCKSEFKQGDVIESKGIEYMKQVKQNMEQELDILEQDDKSRVLRININNKSIDQVEEEINNYIIERFSLHE